MIVSLWEIQTKELLNLIEMEIREVEESLSLLKQEKWAIEESLRIYAKRMGAERTKATQPLTQEDIEGKSNREILHLIAERCNGMLIGKDAVKLMKNANLFANPDNANSIVYNILNGYPAEFVKISKGVYRLNGGNKIPTPPKHKTKQVGLLRQTIRELKEKHPEMTKKEALDFLISHGFNFGGKRPGPAVHMAWISMGYHKTPPMQSPNPLSSAVEQLSLEPHSTKGGLPF